MIDNLIGFKEALINLTNTSCGGTGSNPARNGYSSIPQTISRVVEAFNNELFCPKCGAPRNYSVAPITSNHYSLDIASKQITFNELPHLYKATCFQCKSTALLLIYQGPVEVELAVLHDTYSGCITSNAPFEVKYYIDQAFRARSVGAVSAAMAMYRSALEWILYKQGYTKRMLNDKINKLEDD